MKKATFLRKMLWLLLIPFLATACDDKMDEHYDIPDWVPASAWEVLQSGEHGNYSIFLEGAELANFKPMLEGQSILTVMAPDDNAFQAYLQKKGYASIKDIPINELKKLIGYHLMYYSYNTSNLINFRPTGSTESDEDREVNAGLYYKHRTNSADEPTMEINPSTGEEILVYHQERYLPVFSYRYFQTKKIDAKENYEYFYPNSTWNGDQGFNVSNASVKEYGVKANNGYIHTLNQVLDPLETIYTELKKRSDYSTFLDLYNAYGVYEQNSTLTSLYKDTYGVNAIYQYTHPNLANIACEWANTDYKQFEKNTKESYTIFAPSNTAIETFFNNFWKKGGYTSLDDVDKTALKELIEQYVYKTSLVFPEEIKKGTLVSASGSAIDNIDFASVKEPIMCVNGAVYGMNEMKLPTMLNSVIAPVYQYKDARTCLYALSGSGIRNSYTSPDSKFILLIPSKEQFEAEQIYTVYSTQTLEQETEDGRVTMGTNALTNIMYMHSANIASGESSQIPATGVRVIPTQSSWNFWFIKDGKITCNALYNSQLNPQSTITNIFCDFTKMSDEKNGSVYQFDYNGLFNAEDGDISRNIAICADKNYVYYCFAQLLKKAGLVSGETLFNAYKFENGIGTRARYTAFIPTNEAIQKALIEGRIPGAINASFDADGTLTGTFNAAELRNYLNAYFITLSSNSITSYPYIGSTMKSGKYVSQQTAAEGETAPALIYTDSGNSLSIQLEGGRKCNVIPDYNYFPFAFEYACFHLIDDTF